MELRKSWNTSQTKAEPGSVLEPGILCIIVFDLFQYLHIRRAEGKFRDL